MNKEEKTGQNEDLISAERKMVCSQMIYFSPHKKTRSSSCYSENRLFLEKYVQEKAVFSFFRTTFVYKI